MSTSNRTLRIWSLQERETLWPYAKAKLQAFATAHGCSMLETPDNPISIAISLNGVLGDRQGHAAGSQAPVTSDLKRPGGVIEEGSEPADVAEDGAGLGPARIEGGVLREEGRKHGEKLPVTFLGSMLFNRFVSGTRVVARGKQQAVEGVSFMGYGAHFDAYPHDYLTIAVALGTTRKDVDEFIARFSTCIDEFRRKNGK